MQLRFAICIPVFNHPKTVVAVIADCLKETSLPIFVIDDGSDESVQNLYQLQIQNFFFDPIDLQAVEKRVIFFRHEKNRGKGHAIQTAINKTVKLGFTHLVTIDADGQHLPKEISKVVQAAIENPWAVILGDREMQTQNVPKSSVFGKAFSNFWVKYETDKVVGDSQSGFRVYPLFYLQTMSFLTGRYDFEVEVLTRLIWKGVEVKSTPITVKYFTSDARVTHFNKFKDNLRLTILNTILVSASLVRRDDSPFKSALATAIGVFVGCLPFYGLHTFIVAAVAFALRMNFIYLWLGTQISIPPMVPVIIAGSHAASLWYLGHPPQGMFGFSSDWMIGIGWFSLTASFLIGIIVFLFKSSIRNKNINKKTTIAVKSNDGFGIAFMRFALQKFGLRTAYFFLIFIIPYYYLFSFRARYSANQYWKIVRPELNIFRRQIKVLQQLFVFAQILVDRAYQKSFAEMQFTIEEGSGVQEFKPEVRKTTKGSIMLQSHLGGWEIAMTYFRRLKLDKKMIAVMYGVEGSYEHSSIQNRDDKLQLAAFNKQQDTIIKLKSHLDRGEVVGLMGDRAVGRSYELVPFFGKLGLFDSSAIRLAQMAQANLFFTFCLRQKYMNYFVNSILADTGSDVFLALPREDKITYLLGQYAKALEEHLNKHPEQWFNFFPFWSEKLF
ncbi:MAG: DUF2062 domain-containing protein [Pseudobdellovibrio sp.]